jgi:hypothetical protein
MNLVQITADVKNAMQLFRNPRDGCGAQFERQADFILE